MTKVDLMGSSHTRPLRYSNPVPALAVGASRSPIPARG